jgi:diguanylate cyclase (GGDEF)-like protein
MTPAYLNGRYVGGWGSSLLLDDLLATSRFEGLPGTDVVLVSREGRLIRHPEYTRQNQAGTERYLDLTKAERPELRALWAFLQRQGERPFQGHVPELDSYVALRRIPTPGWYALTLQRVDVVEAGARRSLYRVLVSAIICLTLQALLLFLILRRRVAAPLQRLIERTGAMASRYADPEAQTRDQAAQGDEIERLAADFDRMADQVTQAHARLEQRVRERTDQLARANDELRALAEIDPLTGLMNRRRLRTEMETALAGAEQGVALAVLLFDVDHFKRINDTHGHQIGDQVLQAIAGECRPLLRPSDCFARIGGEEFMVVLRDLTLLDAWQVAERVREGLELLPVPTDRGDVRFTVSIGLTSYARGDSAEALYRRADEALYDAKRSGRNRTRIVERPPEQSTAAA